MFTMAKIRDGSTYLGNHLCANDYYSKNEKVSGVWQGELARAWGIEGQRIDADGACFENLRVGLTPDGEEKLTQRGGGEVRFYDFQCAASKSVSVQSMFDARLSQAHERAAQVAFSEQRADAGLYQSGMIVTFRQDGAGAKRGQSVAIETVEAGPVRLANGATLALGKAARFDVSRPRELAVAVGDRLLMRANSPDKKLVNGAVLTLVGIEAKTGRIRTVEGPMIPTEFRTFAHGYVVTSHKAQGRTHDVVVAAMVQANAQTFYVTASRGRKECALYTPDKLALAERLPRSGERRAALDVLKAERGSQTKAPSHGILGRAKAWMDVKLEQAVKRIGGRGDMGKAQTGAKAVEHSATAPRSKHTLPFAKRGGEQGVDLDR